MKTVEELQSLYNEMEQAYNTIAMSDMEYDPATVDYAKKCRDDAEKALRNKTNKEVQILRAKKKPIVVEAIQFTGSEENFKLLVEWSNNKVALDSHRELAVQTLEGVVLTIRRGAYIVKGINGEVWPIQEAIFNETYEILEGK